MINEKLYMVAALKISTENLYRKSRQKISAENPYEIDSLLMAHCSSLIAHGSLLIAHRSLLRAQSLPPKQGDRGGLPSLIA